MSCPHKLGGCCPADHAKFLTRSRLSPLGGTLEEVRCRAYAINASAENQCAVVGKSLKETLAHSPTAVQQVGLFSPVSTIAFLTNPPFCKSSDQLWPVHPCPIDEKT